MARTVGEGITRLNSPDLDECARGRLADRLECLVLSTQGPVGARLAYLLLGSCSNYVPADDLVNHITANYGFDDRSLETMLSYFGSAEPTHAGKLLAAFAAVERSRSAPRKHCMALGRAVVWEARGPRWASNVLRMLPKFIAHLSTPRPLPDSHVRRLVSVMSDISPDASALVYAAFRDRLTPADGTRLVAAASKGMSAEAKERVRVALSKLEADDFEARKQATEDITGNISSEFTYDCVKKLLGEPGSSPDVKYLAGVILLDPRSTRTKSYRVELSHAIREGFVSNDVPTLELLAGGDPRLGFVRDARERLTRVAR